jgi:hypothetical protein
MVPKYFTDAKVGGVHQGLADFWPRNHRRNKHKSKKGGAQKGLPGAEVSSQAKKEPQGCPNPDASGAQQDNGEQGQNSDG